MSTRKAYDLTATELENSTLADLARECGYSSLKSMLNEHSRWDDEVTEIEQFLRDQLNTPADEE